MSDIEITKNNDRGLELYGKPIPLTILGDGEEQWGSIDLIESSSVVPKAWLDITVEDKRIGDLKLVKRDAAGSVSLALNVSQLRTLGDKIQAFLSTHDDEGMSEADIASALLGD